MHQLIFDLPVSVNKMYSHSWSGIRLSDAARVWKEYAALTGANQWHMDCGQDEPLKGDLVVIYHFHGSHMDFDNPLKVLNDALNGICWIDDEQITEAHIYVYRKDKIRRVELQINRKAS